MTTTAADLLHLLRFIASDGQIGGRRLIDTGLLRAMGRPHGTAAARAAVTTGDGLGLFTRDRHGAVGLCHGGSTAGWRDGVPVSGRPARGRARFRRRHQH